MFKSIQVINCVTQISQLYQPIKILETFSQHMLFFSRIHFDFSSYFTNSGKSLPLRQPADFWMKKYILMLRAHFLVHFSNHSGVQSSAFDEMCVWHCWEWNAVLAAFLWLLNIISAGSIYSLQWWDSPFCVHNPVRLSNIDGAHWAETAKKFVHVSAQFFKKLSTILNMSSPLVVVESELQKRNFVIVCSSIVSCNHKLGIISNIDRFIQLEGKCSCFFSSSWLLGPKCLHE